MEKREKKTLLIIDANSLIHRAFHALPPLSTSKGEMVNAVYGFLLVFFKAVKEFKPDYIAAAFDMRGPTLRHEKFAAYKATRVKAADELYRQIPLVKKVLGAFGIPVYEKQGFEADDIVGTIAKTAPKKQAYPPIESIIVSGDLDTLQLIDEHTRVYTMRKSIRDSVLYDEDAVIRRFQGLRADQVPDYKGLRGDPSDNIPGVKGIGEKTAIQLLNEFKTLEELYEKVESGETKERVKPRIAELLKKSKERAFLSRDLATIDRNVPIDLELKELEWKGSHSSGVASALREFEFEALLSRIIKEENEQGGNATIQREKGQAQMFSLKNGGAGGPQVLAREGQDVFEKIEHLYVQGVFSKEIYELEKQLVPVIRSMEERGIKIDMPYFAKFCQDIAEELGDLEKKIHTLASLQFNINSPSQLSDVLFETLKLPTKGIRKTPGGVLSTASEELEKLRGQHGIVDELLTFRELQKLFTTYLKPLPQLADESSRLHTHFDQLGAATGRISSLNPNLQNIPLQGEQGKKVRRGFIAENGWKFVSFDYSQIELRIAAHIANDLKMQEFFRQGADIHRMTAAEVFGVPSEKVTPEMRYRAKALNFGVLYGMGATGFARSARIPVEDARVFIESYFARFPEVYEYTESIKESARKQGYVETLFGRKRYLPDMYSDVPQFRASAERMAVNHPIQGSVADMMKMAMVKVFETTKPIQSRCRMLLQIHDELLFEISDDTVVQRTVIQEIRSVLENVYKLKVPVEVEIKTGENWSDMV